MELLKEDLLQSKVDGLIRKYIVKIKRQLTATGKFQPVAMIFHSFVIQVFAFDFTDARAKNKAKVEHFISSLTERNATAALVISHRSLPLETHSVEAKSIVTETTKEEQKEEIIFEAESRSFQFKVTLPFSRSTSSKPVFGMPYAEHTKTTHFGDFFGRRRTGLKKS
jgi:hypothetical protein